MAERKKKKKEKLRRAKTGDQGSDRPPPKRAAQDAAAAAQAPRVDNVRFGEVAQDIPHFTVLPRGRKPAALPASGPDAAGKRILEAERQRVIDHYRQLKLAKMLGSHKPAS